MNARRPASRVVAAVVTVMATMAALGMLTACSSATGEGQVTTYALADRKPAPAVQGATLDGGQLSLASFRGKVVVLNFWGSWCPPCRVEAPFLQDMATRFASRGVQFVGLDLRSQSYHDQSFFENVGGSVYPNLVDPPDASISVLFNGIVPADAVPSTIIIDRSGNVAARIVGPTTEPRLTAVLAPLVAEGS